MANKLLVRPRFYIMGDGVSLTSTISISDVTAFIGTNTGADYASVVAAATGNSIVFSGPTNILATATLGSGGDTMVLTFPAPLASRILYAVFFPSELKSI